MKFAETVRKLLPGVWFGLLAAIAFIATPAAFRTLARADAGLVVRQIFAWEAGTSLLFGALLLVIERRAGLQHHLATGASQFSAGMMLAMGALFCTLVGDYAMMPMMDAARAGASTPLDFAQLHLLSTTFFGAKGLLVLALAWRAVR